MSPREEMVTKPPGQVFPMKKAAFVDPTGCLVNWLTSLPFVMSKSSKLPDFKHIRMKSLEQGSQSRETRGETSFCLEVDFVAVSCRKISPSPESPISYPTTTRFGENVHCFRATKTEPFGNLSPVESSCTSPSLLSVSKTCVSVVQKILFESSRFQLILCIFLPGASIVNKRLPLSRFQIRMTPSLLKTAISCSQLQGGGGGVEEEEKEKNISVSRIHTHTMLSVFLSAKVASQFGQEEAKG